MNIETIAEQLERVGYIVLDQPLRPTISALLLARCQDDDGQRFEAGQIGRGVAKKLDNAIRGDVICWLDDTDNADRAYLAWMERLRIGLNEARYLGLFDYECHYAIYSAGSSYATHSDVLTGTKDRILSTVLYLNENWRARDGGELVLFDPNDGSVIATVQPTFGTMILFLSDSFPHEVLISHAKRRSIAGWFRARNMT